MDMKWSPSIDFSLERRISAGESTLNRVSFEKNIKQNFYGERTFCGEKKFRIPLTNPLSLERRPLRDILWT